MACLQRVNRARCVGERDNQLIRKPKSESMIRITRQGAGETPAGKLSQTQQKQKQGKERQYDDEHLRTRLPRSIRTTRLGGPAQ